MNNNPNTLAQTYLDRKNDLLNQCLSSTEALLGAIGDIKKSNDILIKRKALLQKLDQLETEFAPSLADYAFNAEELTQLEALAEKLWHLDDKVTQTMKENKEAILKSFH